MRYLERFKVSLVNPSSSEIELRDLLSNFSFYLSGRVNVLCMFAEEIIENLDTGFSASPVQGGRIERAESLMWLWVLGAYEVVRTMVQAEKCFSPSAMEHFRTLKKSLAAVRMPASKMEKQGKRIPVNSNRSPAGWDVENRDLLVNDPDDPEVSARRLFNDFDETFLSLRKADILARHEDSYL